MGAAHDARRRRRDGLLPLAPTFDTVGWLTRAAELLARVGDVLLPTADPQQDKAIVVVPELVALAEPDVAAAVTAFADRVGATPESWDLTALPDWRLAFTAFQAWEAWQAHGAWLADRLDTLGADVRGRFTMASRITAEEGEKARIACVAAGSRIRDLVGDRVVLLPSASSVAPLVGDDLDRIREATLRLTCLGGLPPSSPSPRSRSRAAPAPTATTRPTTEPSGASGGAADFGDISVQLSWIKNAEFAGEFFADAKGYYKDAGFAKVNLLAGPGRDRRSSSPPARPTSA